MLPSAGLALFALLRRTRSIGKTLKSFILRCLLFFPHVLRRLGQIWPLSPRTSPKDVPKKKGGPSFTGTSGVCEGYGTIHASRDFNRTGEPHFSVGPGSADVLPLGPTGQWRSQSAPHSPASSTSLSLPGSPRRSDRSLSRGSTPSIASSQNADSVHGVRPLTIRHLNTPLTLTHSRVTSAQFAGVLPTRPRSPSPISIPLTVSFPSPLQPLFPSPSLSPSPHSHPLPRSSTPESSGSTQISNVIPQASSDGSHPSSFAIRVSPPSRSQTLEHNSQSTSNSPHSPLFVQPGHLSGPSQSPTAESDHSTQGTSDPRGLCSPHLGSAHGTTYSSGVLPAGIPTSSLDQTQYGPSFPQPTTSLSLIHIPIADTAGTLPDGRTRSIRLMTSEQVSRFVNKGDVPPVKSLYRLSPMEVDLPRYSHEICPEGWVPVTHPGGSLYFYNPVWRIFTDVYMYDSDLSTEILEFAAHLERERTRLLGKINFPTNDYDLVLDIIKTEDDDIIWAYYYVDHHTRTLFWLHYYECGETLLGEVPGALNASHVKLRLEAIYWVHWSLYPTGPVCRRFPNNASNELLGALLSSGIDSLTSKVSTSPYSVTEIESMRGFIKEAEGLGQDNPHVITSVARLLSFYSHWRFVHFHGQKSSRQDRHRSIYKDSCRKRTMFIRILSPILFFFPNVHLLELEKLWTDKIIVEALWKEFMQKLVSEWTDFVLYSTVMLAANVAFLAIPGVIVAPQFPPPANQWIKASPAQIISSISLMFSIGSIITGLLLIRRNRTMMSKDPRNAWYYLHGMQWRVVGLEPLAIVFSLTYALLMWSAWGFFLALSIFSFQNTSRGIRIPVGIAAAVVTILIIWCIRNTWDPAELEEEPNDWPSVPELAIENNTQA